MEIATVVRSIAGHDANRFFAVVGISGDFALLCDGKTRPLDRPKKKRIKHLQKTNTVLSHNCLTTDKQLRNALHPFNYGAESC